MSTCLRRLVHPFVPARARPPALSLLALLMVFAPVAASGQPSPLTTVRVKIREDVAVLGDGITVVGELLRRDSSGLVVHRFTPPDTMRIAIGAIERADYLRATGRDGGTTLRTAALIGAGTGAVVGYVAGSGMSKECMVLCSAGAIAVLGGAAGALVGLVVGIPIAAATSDRWVRFEPADVRVSAAVVPTARGVGVGLRWTP